MVTTAQSLASLVDVEVWPEMWARRVMARSSICCELNQKKNVRGGAGDRGEEEARGSLARSESTGDLCRFAVFRRAIPRRPGEELEGKQREKGAEALGYL
jgi:hypothetical protein